MSNIQYCLLLTLGSLLAQPVSAAVLAGKVINAAAHPVENAQVRAGKAATHTDKNGYFRLHVPDQNVELQVFQSAYGAVKGEVTAPDAGVLVYLAPHEGRVLQPAAHQAPTTVQPQTTVPKRAPAPTADLDSKRLCQVCSAYLPMTSGG